LLVQLLRVFVAPSRGQEGTMAQEFRSGENTPQHHTAKIKDMLTGIIEHVRSDVEKVSEPKAQALFETTAEVLIGLRKAYDDYDQGTETAWRKAS
jgi:hypothetical protein